MYATLSEMLRSSSGKYSPELRDQRARGQGGEAMCACVLVVVVTALLDITWREGINTG